MNDEPRPSTDPHDSGPALIPEVLERADVESGAYDNQPTGEFGQTGTSYTFSEGRFRIWTCSPGCILIVLLICALLSVAIFSAIF